MRVQEFKRPGVQQARSSGGQEFRGPAVQEARSSGGQESVMRRPVGCQESVRRPGGGSELSGVQEARSHLSGDHLQEGCGHSAE